MNFVHLHVHSHLSILDSTIQIPDLVKRVRDAGMPAVALTDHDNLFGVVQFVRACRKAELKPIIGCEVTLADDRTQGRKVHVVLLCRSAEGFANLRTLVTRSYLDGLRDGTPTVTHDLLAGHASGLIALSGCLGGEIPGAILRGDLDAALAAARWYEEVFPNDRFFLELQANELSEQDQVNEALLDLSARTGIPVVATNNAHYLTREDASAHAALVAIALDRRDLTPAHLSSIPLRSFHLALPDEMARAFHRHPEAVQNTLRIAQDIAPDVFLPDQSGKPVYHFPLFPTPAGHDPASYLREIATQGLRARLDAMHARGENPEERAYLERLDYELKVIHELGFDTYYLIVWDFIRWARGEGIPVGPGRGSGAGSLVAYAIGVTDLDPMRYHLLFERFLNPERVSPPDFDVDFCERRRDEVIAHVRDLYGRDRVGQIITFSTLGAKAAVRDVARVLGLPHSEADRLAKMIPQQLDITLEKAIAQEPKIAELIRGPGADPTIQAVFEVAGRLEGLTRQVGKHAAGVVIADRPISDYAPLYQMDDGVVVTQYEMKDLDAVGLIKFDFLGLTTLSVIDDCIRLIRERHDPRFRIEEIPLDDRPTYDLISSGRTVGVFQLESRGITDVVRRLKPDCFEDLVALLALYRPGPLGGGMVSDFIDRKHGVKQVSYPIPDLEPILKETYGIILYQEQVMLIASRIAGFTLGQADLLRRAMGKKKKAELEAHREPFIAGATARGVPRATAEQLFETMEHFASYGFNKSHSAAYALLTYRTAYLKAHYPPEFLCAMLTAEKGSQDKVMSILSEASALGVPAILPDVNRSQADFTVEDARGSAPDRPAVPSIRFGLGAIKGIGEAAVEAILEARRDRPFEGVLDFLTRVDSRKVNRRVVEALIRSGAFDSFGHTRRALAENLDGLMERAQSRRSDADSGQLGLFDSPATPSHPDRVVPDAPEWPIAQLLAEERAAIGYYLSGHPMDEYREELESHRVRPIAELAESAREDMVIPIAGIVTQRIEKVSKTGGRMAFVTLEDPTGRIECRIFSNVYDQWAAVRDLTEPLLMRGSVRIESDGETETVRFLVNSVERLEAARFHLAQAVRVTLDLLNVSEQAVERLREVVKAHTGTCPLQFAITLKGAGTVILQASRECFVEPGRALLSEIEAILGPGCVQLR